MAKTMTAAGPVEGPWALPDGWRWERLGSILPLAYGKALKANDRAGGDVPVYGSSGIAGSHDQALCSEPALIVGRKGSAGAVYHAQGPSFAIDTAYFCSATTSKIDLRLGFHLLSFLNLRKLDQSTAVPSLSRDSYNQQVVPVPPQDRQKGIAARIDELFAEIDDGEAALARARDDLATWRKALLKAAVTGELTADWRAGNPPAETGGELLRRILTARRTEWETQARNRRQPYVEPTGPSLETLPTLPDHWTWATLAQLASIGSGTTPGRTEPLYWGGDVPWLKSGCVNDDVVVAADEYVTSLAVRDARLKTYPAGTLVVALYGEGKTRGKCAVLDIAACVNQALGAVQVVDGVEAGWIKIVLDSNYEKNRMISAGGVQPNLNLIKLSELHIPLPPSAERKIIAARVEEDLAAQEDLGEVRMSAVGLSATLRQSVLAAAFRGELA